MLSTEARITNFLVISFVSVATGEEARSPQKPYLDPDIPNLGRSIGFEGISINPKGDKLYSLLEGTMARNPAKGLRIGEYDIIAKCYTDNNYPGAGGRDLNLDDTEFLKLKFAVPLDLASNHDDLNDDEQDWSSLQGLQPLRLESARLA